VGDAWSDMLDYLGSDAAWSGRNALPALLAAHIRLSLLAIVVAVLVAIPPAVVLGHLKRGGVAAVWVVNVGRAIPSFAIIALVLPFSLRWGFGLGFWPTMVALVLLAIPPIFTNTYTGVRDVPADAVEAARGMGMTERQVLTTVELPLSWPLIFAGIRTAAVYVVATAPLAAIAGGGGLGDIILNQPTYRLVGVIAATIVVVVLAFAVDALFAIVQRAVTPRGLALPRELATIVPAGTDTAITAEAAASAEKV